MDENFQRGKIRKKQGIIFIHRKRTVPAGGNTSIAQIWGGQNGYFWAKTENLGWSKLCKSALIFKKCFC